MQSFVNKRAMANTDLKNHTVAVSLSESAAVAENNDVKPNFPTECPEKEENTGLQPATEQEGTAGSDEETYNDCTEDQNTEDTELLQDDVRDDTENISKGVDIDTEPHMSTQCLEQNAGSNEGKVDKDMKNEPENVEKDEKKDAGKKPVEINAYENETADEEPGEIKADEKEPVETQEKVVATKRITQEKVDDDVVSNKKLKSDSQHENAPERIVCEE